MNDPLEVLRAKARPVVRDRKDRAEATGSPDARKARDIVRSIAKRDAPADVPLFEVALEIAKVTADPEERHLLEDRANAFVQATQNYNRVQGQVDRPICWMGHGPTGNFPWGSEVPPGTPEHKILLIVSWGALLRVVNEATKVGVQKRSKYAPITLQVDPDVALPALAVPGGWD